MITLTDENFEREILNASKPILVDFWAEWCMPCFVLGPILEKIAEEYNDKLKICKINIDDHKSAATRYQVLSIPTLLFFKDGKIATQIVGVRSASDIKNTVNSLI